MRVDKIETCILRDAVMSKMTELKLCPFCGGKAKRRYAQPFSWVQCTECKATSAYFGDTFAQCDGKEDAIAAWNRRVAQVVLDDEKEN